MRESLYNKETLDFFYKKIIPEKITQEFCTQCAEYLIEHCTETTYKKLCILKDIQTDIELNPNVFQDNLKDRLKKLWT